MSFGSTSGVTFSGIGSGIDTESIVTRLMQLERRQSVTLQQRKATINEKKGIYGELKTHVAAFRSASGALNNLGAFNSITSNVSDSAAATLIAGDASVPGTYALKTFQLAQSHKVGSNAQAGIDTALGLAGTIKVNDKEIAVVATDTLKTLAEKINTSGGTVVASIIDGGANKAYLNLTSGESGTKGNLKLTDVSGSVLSSLGFTGTTVREPVTDGYRTFAADSATTKLADLFGFTATGPTNITINGQTITVDPNSDTLTTLASKIDDIDEVTATVVPVTEMGRTTYRVEIKGGSFTPSMSDSNNMLVDLGVTRRSNELVAAQDALYSLDGIALRSSTNAVTGAIPGSTVTLLQADKTTGKETTLTLTRDGSAIKSKIQAFVAAYNNVAGFVADNSKFDKDSFASGPLFGDATARQVMSDLQSTLQGNIPGLSIGSNNAAAAGLSFNTDGTVKFDAAVFDKALKADPMAVQKMFRAYGAGSTTDISYVGSTTETKASGTGSYSVNITQAATKQTVTAAAALAGNTTTLEILSFTGGGFGSGSVSINIEAGRSLTDIVNQINADSKLKDLVTASQSSGKLVLTSNRFGTPGNFTVTSTLAAGGTNSGIGTTGQAVTVAGKDVAGTINGEPATGVGQFLTGASNATTNPKTYGLQIMYTGSATGQVGSLGFTKGLAALMNERLDSFTATTNGLLTANENALQAQIDDFDDTLANLDKQLTAKESNLRQKFLAMEQAISAAQQQQQRLSAMLPR